MAEIENAGFKFFSDFDSANLAKVEHVPRTDSIVSAVNAAGKSVTLELPDVEFNLWTRPDCAGTEFENGNRTWFYFGVQASGSGLLVKLNLVDINRQSKMYSQGMCPVYRIVPGRSTWERVRDKPTYTMDDNIFTVTFKYRTPENTQSITYFAFTYPYTYTELQASLGNFDSRFSTKNDLATSQDDIYYVRECACHSLEGKRVDLITVSSQHGITTERETRLKNLFPEKTERPFKFVGKKVIFVSARVHPGETPSSFVFNGFLNLLLTRDDPIAVTLRKTYVFKLIPFLNPDGVFKGHYRTDTRGVNLNRVYLNPDFSLHPSIYAARAIIRYHHYGFEKEEEASETNLHFLESTSSNESLGQTYPTDNKLSKQVSIMTLDENKQNRPYSAGSNKSAWSCDCKSTCKKCCIKLQAENDANLEIIGDQKKISGSPEEQEEDSCSACGDAAINSGIFLYMDLHGHASKKGIFMYGNHFKDVERNVECMLLPKLMSLNNHNFHFTNCNFTERNMYLKDRRDGLSREGSGRVSVLKITGLVRSYTLECNYNTGRIVNVLPSTIKETSKAVHTMQMPPKYNPQVFEDVGRAMGGSILDLTGSNPHTRVPNSEFRSLDGLKDWLRIHLHNELGFGRHPKITPAANIQTLSQGTNRKKVKSTRTVSQRPRSLSTKCIPHAKRIPIKTRPPTSVPIERKENVGVTSQCSGVATSSRTPSKTKTIMGDPKTFFKRPPSKPSLTLRGRNMRDSGTIKSKTTNDNTKMVVTMPNSRQKIDANSKLDCTSKCSTTPDSTPRAMKLHEICYVKGNDGKKLVAKYLIDNNTEGNEAECENLVVSWNANNSATVFSEKSSPPLLPSTAMVSDDLLKFSPKEKNEPSTSSSTTRGKCGGYRVAKFTATKSKRFKINKPLTSSGKSKVDKFKSRKKLRAKLI